MKTKTTEGLLRELAHIRRQIDEYDERAEIATRKIEETPYADEIRFVYAAIDRLDERADAIEQTVRTRTAQELERCCEYEARAGVLVKVATTRTVTFSKDLSMYLEEEEDEPCT